MRVVPQLATLHAVACVLLGVAVAVFRPPRDIAYVVAYMTGSEVLWRMARADVFHELAKYAVALVLMIGLARIRARRNRLIVLAYFALLLPSVLLTVFAPDIDAREQISFNLSGPFSLMLCVWFFSSLRLTAADVRAVFFSVIGPLLSISTLVYLSTGAAKELVFKSDSNHATSGGFGPNQVSAVLGLGVLFVLLMLLDGKMRWRARPLLMGLLVLFGVQSALTFSRGGLALAFASALAAMAYLVRDQRRRVTLIVLCGLGFAVANYIIVPRLESFTGGEIADRYSDTSSTGRVKLAGYDLEIFEDHPVFGVGPGRAIALRREMGRLAAAHTEYTRMLAEHGVFGALSMVMLFVLIWRTFRRARTLESRALVVAMLSWFALFFAIYGTRLVAPSFIFGMACTISTSSLPLKQPKRR